MRDVDRSKILLAKILSQENITVRITRGHNASFDLKTRILSIPEMKDDLPDCLYNLIVGHEVAHALETPITYEDTPEKYKFSSDLLNIVEDIRIEKIIQQDYPGLKRDFIQGYKELLVRNSFGIKGKKVNNLNFLDRLNIHAKCGISVGVEFSPIEQVLVDRAFSIWYWTETIDICLEIAKFLKETKKQTPFPPIPPPDENETDDESEGGGYEPPDEDNSPNNGDDKNIDNSPINGDNEDIDVSNDDGILTGDDSIGDSKEDENDLEKSVTDKFLERSKQELFETDQEKIIHQIDLPIINCKKYIIPHIEIASILTTEIYMASEEWEDKKISYVDPEMKYVNVFLPGNQQKVFSEFQKNNKNVVDYMAKEFLLKQNADTIKRTSIAKTGLINTKQLFSFRYNNDIFLRNTIVREGKSHGMLIYLDWSGSMSYNLLDSIQQLFCLLDFCKKINIPFEVYAFSDQYSDQKNEVIDYTEFKENEVVIKNTFRLFQFFTDKMTPLEYTMMQKNLLTLAKYGQPEINFFGMSGTPLNETIICALEMVPDFQRRNSVQIVNTVFITDGESNPISVMRNGWPIQNYEKEASIFLEDQYHNVVKASNWQVTDKLLVLLRKRTNANVIGFLLTEWKDSYAEMVPNATKTAARAEFVNNGFITSLTSGYTEFYIINANRLKIKKEETPKNILEAMKQNRNTIKNRTMLNRVIDLVSRQPD